VARRGAAAGLLGTLLALWAAYDCGRTAAAEIIAPDRRIDWSPGIPGGIPAYPSDVNAKDAPYAAKGDGTADDTAAIQRALDDCPAGKAVFLPAGRYKTTKPLRWKKAIVLRGAGPTQTRILAGPGAKFDSILEIGTNYKNTETVPVTAGSEAGSGKLTLADAAKVSAGDLIAIWQENDPAVVGQVPSFDKRVASQMAVVVAKTGNTVALTRPLYRTFRKDLQAGLLAYPTCSKAGIEDLDVERTAGEGYDNVTIRCSAYCWVKNVESYMTRKWHVRLDRCYACEVRDCYLHDSYNAGGDGDYGAGCYMRSTDNLIENNVFVRCRHAMIVECAGCGNVYGYNYSRDPINEGGPRTDFLMSDISLHGGCPYMNLFEGNVAAHIDCDHVLGSSRNNTFFRNYIERKSIPAVKYGMWGIAVQMDNLFANVVGNVIARLPAYAPPTGAWRIGYDELTTTLDPRVAATLLRHGNVDEAAGRTEWDDKIQERKLPASLYLRAKPAFFGDHPWPAIGPDVERHAGFLPAKDRYDRELRGRPPIPAGFQQQ
jgi:hypothetical protein